MKKKIGELTLSEIIKNHKNSHTCGECPYCTSPDDSKKVYDYKKHLCNIACSNIGLDLNRKIEVKENEQ